MADIKALTDCTFVSDAYSSSNLLGLQADSVKQLASGGFAGHNSRWRALLHQAVVWADEGMLEVLLQHGADPDIKDWQVVVALGVLDC